MVRVQLADHYDRVTNLEVPRFKDFPTANDWTLDRGDLTLLNLYNLKVVSFGCGDWKVVERIEEPTA